MKINPYDVRLTFECPVCKNTATPSIIELLQIGNPICCTGNHEEEMLLQEAELEGDYTALLEGNAQPVPSEMSLVCVTFGNKPLYVKVHSLEEASTVYRDWINRENLSSRDLSISSGLVAEGNRCIALIHFNGKIEKIHSS